MGDFHLLPTMYECQSNKVRVVVTMVSSIIGVAAIILVIILAHTVANTTIPFDNDEANHALDGWEVYHATVNLAPSDMFLAVRNQSFYPPMHSFFVAAAYLLAGPSVASSRMPTVINFTLTLLGLVWLTFRIARREDKNPGRPDPWVPAAGAAFAVALAISSHDLVVNAVLCMLEMTGAMLAILLMLIADRVDELRHGPARWVGVVAAALTAMVIFLTKYSFGLFYGPGLIAALLTATWPWKSGRRAWLEMATVTGIHATVLTIWLLITHRQTMAMFFTDHPSLVPFWSAENLLYLPKLWLSGYSINAVTGLVAILLSLVGTVHQWKRLPVRVAAWSILTATIMLTISTTNIRRHILVVTPAIWMLAGLGLVKVLRWLQSLPRDGMKVAYLLGFLISFLIISAIRPASRLHAELVKEFEGLPVYAEMQEFALQQVDLDQPILLIGELTDQNGLLAIRWRAAVISGKSLGHLDIDYFPFGDFDNALRRTNRKPQIASVDPTFSWKSLSANLDRDYYAYVIEIRHLDDQSGIPPGHPHDTLYGYPYVYKQFYPWSVLVYDLTGHEP